MDPVLNKGEYVFVTLMDETKIDQKDIIFEFKEREGRSLILEKSKADVYQLEYGFVASWITLRVHSSLEAVGLTAAVSTVMAENNISCNMVAAYYHNHVFVNREDAKRAMMLIRQIQSESKESIGIDPKPKE